MNANAQNPIFKQRPQLDGQFIDDLTEKAENRYPDFQRDTIESITFLDTLKNMPADHIILSEDQHGTIYAWVTLSVSEKYNVSIAAEGGVSAAPDMSSIFEDCTSLKMIDFGGFNTSKVTNMCHMFDCCESLTNIDLATFDTSKVTDMCYMFGYCKALTNIDLGSFDTSKVTNMSGMFDCCEVLKSIDLGSFNTSKVTNMRRMFSYCKALTNINFDNFNTSNVTDMSDIFLGCSKLNPDIKKKFTANAPD